MATRIIWAPPAVDDLDQIVEFISRDSPRYGAQVAADVLEAVERMVLFPRSGRVVPELNDPLIRETFVYRYRVIYRIDNETIQVAAIVHGARNLENALDERAI